jgi:hypothetical protein
MYRSETRRLENGHVQHCRMFQDDRPLTWYEVVDRWQNDQAFGRFFVSLLVDAPFHSYFWETPPLTSSTFDREFEFVFVDSPQLADVPSDRRAFGEHFASAAPGASVIEFSNLGGDAMLVVPCPVGPLSAYSQIAAFARQAPEAQQLELWQRVGAALERRLGSRPVWVSTSGLGVYWLHIRLDSTPKYYTYQSFRAPPDQEYPLSL